MSEPTDAKACPVPQFANLPQAHPDDHAVWQDRQRDRAPAAEERAPVRGAGGEVYQRADRGVVLSVEHGTASAQAGGATPAARGRRVMAAALSVAWAAALLLRVTAGQARAQSPYLVNDTVDAIDSNLNDGLHCVLWQGGGIFLAAGSTTFVADTIVAKNGRGHDCAGPGSVTSSGGNVQGDGSCPFNHATDRTGDPGFDPGALGPPRWFPLLPTSPAVDVPTTLICGVGPATVDIRGAVRPQGGDPDNDGFLNCDSGSFEL